MSCDLVKQIALILAIRNTALAVLNIFYNKKKMARSVLRNIEFSAACMSAHVVNFDVDDMPG